MYRSTNQECRSTNQEYRSTNQECRSTNQEYRSTNQECRSTNQKYRSTNQECRSTNQDRSAVPLNNWSYAVLQFMSSVTCYLIIGAFLATLCVHDIFYFTFMVTFQFFFIFHIIFMFHEHRYTFCISYIIHVTITYGISYTYIV